MYHHWKSDEKVKSSKDYKNPVPRREKVIAALCVVGIIGITAVAIWFFRPETTSSPTNIPSNTPTVPIITTPSVPETTVPVPGG